MSCQFVCVMALTLSAARELEKPILVDLLSDYAKEKSNNKLQYVLIQLLAKKNAEGVREEHRKMYNVIRRYLQTNHTNVTKELIWAQ